MKGLLDYMDSCDAPLATREQLYVRIAAFIWMSLQKLRKPFLKAD